MSTRHSPASWGGKKEEWDLPQSQLVPHGSHNSATGTKCGALHGTKRGPPPHWASSEQGGSRQCWGEELEVPACSLAATAQLHPTLCSTAAALGPAQAGRQLRLGSVGSNSDRHTGRRKTDLGQQIR